MFSYTVRPHETNSQCKESSRFHRCRSSLVEPTLLNNHPCNLTWLEPFSTIDGTLQEDSLFIFIDDMMEKPFVVFVCLQLIAKINICVCLLGFEILGDGSKLSAAESEFMQMPNVGALKRAELG